MSLLKMSIKVKLFRGGPQKIDNFEIKWLVVTPPIKILGIIVILVHRPNEEREMQLVGCSFTSKEPLT